MPREKAEDFHFLSQSVQGTTINGSGVMYRKNHEEPMLEGTKIHAVRLEKLEGPNLGKIVNQRNNHRVSMTETGKNGINHDEGAPKFSTNSLVKEWAEPCLKDLDQLKEIPVLGLKKKQSPTTL